MAMEVPVEAGDVYLEPFGKVVDEFEVVIAGNTKIFFQSIVHSQRLRYGLVFPYEFLHVFKGNHERSLEGA